MIASLLKFLALLAAAYGLLLAWLYWQQPRMLYFPQPMTPTASTPARAGLDYEDVNLLTDDGVALHGRRGLRGGGHRLHAAAHHLLRLPERGR